MPLLQSIGLASPNGLTFSSSWGWNTKYEWSHGGSSLIDCWPDQVILVVSDIVLTRMCALHIVVGVGGTPSVVFISHTKKFCKVIHFKIKTKFWLLSLEINTLCPFNNNYFWADANSALCFSMLSLCLAILNSCLVYKQLIFSAVPRRCGRVFQ